MKSKNLIELLLKQHYLLEEVRDLVTQMYRINPKYYAGYFSKAITKVDYDSKSSELEIYWDEGLMEGFGGDNRGSGVFKIPISYFDLTKEELELKLKTELELEKQKREEFLKEKEYKEYLRLKKLFEE